MKYHEIIHEQCLDFDHQDIVEESMDDNKHSQHLAKTGFWGAMGAGCIFVAKDTGRLLIAHRAAFVEQPGTWGTWGGAIDSNENPKEALKREIHEETGFSGAAELVPLHVFEKPGFKYYNYLAVVDKEFTPKLDWENQGFIWCKLDDMPHPLHFGLAGILNNAQSMSVINKYLK